jgi:hypothetical protein
MEKITRRVLELARCYGAGAVGIVSTEMLAEGPPSTDLTYVLPDAKSAVSFALIKAVGPYLKRPKSDSAVFNTLMPGDKVELTCGNCQLICHPDKDVRKKRYKLLTESTRDWWR